jgi:hypothetical protein
VAGDNDYWDDFHPPEEQFTAANPLMFDESAGSLLGRPVGSSAARGGFYSPVSAATTSKVDDLNLTLLENDQLHHY